MLRILLAIALTLAPLCSLRAQMLQSIVNAVAASGGGTPPAFSSATSSFWTNTTGTTFVTANLSVTAGQLVTGVLGGRGPLHCAGITVISTNSGSSTGDTLTMIPVGGPVSSAGFSCAWMFMTVSSVTSSTYQISLSGSATFSASNPYSITIFDPGSLMVAIDGTPCSNASDANSGTTMACSGSMTPAGTQEILLAGIVEYSAATVTGTGGCAVPSGGTFSTGPASGICYAINAAGATTPGFANMASGDAASMVGVFIK